MAPHSWTSIMSPERSEVAEVRAAPSLVEDLWPFSVLGSGMEPLGEPGLSMVQRSSFRRVAAFRGVVS